MTLRQELVKNQFEEKKRLLTKLESHLSQPRLFHECLLSFPRKERLDILINQIGKSKLVKAELIQTTYSAYKFCRALPNNKIIDFFKAMYTQNELYQLRETNFYWDKIKLRLKTVNADECEKLNQLTYSQEDIAAKVTIKKLKKTILNTNWEFRFFESSVIKQFKDRVITVPEVMENQIHEIMAVSRREKTHTEALDAIKAIGKKGYESRNSFSSQLLTLFSAKTNIDIYFDSFADEETFRAKYA